MRQTLINALGPQHGIHKQCATQLAVINLPAQERFAKENIFLAGCCRASTNKRHGVARTTCGVDKRGKEHDEDNFAADLRALRTETSSGDWNRKHHRLWCLLATCQ